MPFPPAPSSASSSAASRPRLVVVPGLRGSGHGHWQTWLEGEVDGAVRVEQDDWHAPDLDRWADRVIETLAALGPGPHVVAAHSFGCLATAHALLREPRLPIASALLVAPAEPAKFGVAHRLPGGRLGVEATVVASDTDPWMTAASARAWALRWGSGWINLGDAGHVNVDAGFGPFPLARDWAEVALRHARRVAGGGAADETAARGFDSARWRVAA
jgi:predicted alpha/beta hydrolase family esterase